MFYLVSLRVFDSFTSVNGGITAGLPAGNELLTGLFFAEKTALTT